MILKGLFKLINNAVFGNTMENVGRHRDIKLVTTGKRRDCLVPEINYHTIKFFCRISISNRNDKNPDTYE